MDALKHVVKMEVVERPATAAQHRVIAREGITPNGIIYRVFRVVDDAAGQWMH